MTDNSTRIGFEFMSYSHNLLYVKILAYLLKYAFLTLIQIHEIQITICML